MHSYHYLNVLSFLYLAIIRLKPFGDVSIEADLIDEIINEISIIKLLITSGICTKELVDIYNAKIEVWEAEIDVINNLT